MRQLGLSLIESDEGNTTKFQTAFATPIDARIGVSSGMSAHDRARTIAVAIADDARPADLIRPGRLLTLRAQTGGVLVRAGHTEAAVDLARMAGLKPAGVICEIMSADGTMARMPELERFAAKHDVRILRIADLVEYRRHERLIRRKAETRLAHPPRRAVRADGLQRRSRVDAVRRAGEGRRGRRRAGAGAAALAVSHRGRLRQRALRLRRAARGRDAAGAARPGAG